jgi:hypothetical protein
MEFFWHIYALIRVNGAYECHRDISNTGKKFLVDLKGREINPF